MDPKTVVRTSKFLSMVLRHKPEEIGITLDENGWADVSAVLDGMAIDRDMLQLVVEINNKQRFEFNEDETKIRARQGHSVDVDLGYQPMEPPMYLFHGTTIRFYDQIMREGLKKQGRHAVHLSENRETASDVGGRHGKPVVLQIRAKELSATGAKFYLTENHVWLTDEVPPEYIEQALF
jgi:putative RNA 2'-phosphotransferase